MFSLNGTGLRYYGIRETDVAEHKAATMWVTLLFLPLIPLRRMIVKPLKRTPHVFQYVPVRRESLRWSEVMTTYCFGWILTPVCALAPLILSIVEVQTFLGIPKSIQPVIMGLSIVWLVVFVWKLKNWEERRWFRSA